MREKISWSIRTNKAVMDKARKAALSMSTTSGMPVSINAFLNRAIEVGADNALSGKMGFIANSNIKANFRKAK